LAQNPMQGFAATPAERRSVFGRAHVDLNDNLTAYAQATYSNIAVKTRGGYPPAITVWQAYVPNDGLRPLPPGLQDLLNSRTRDPDGPGPLLVGDPTGASAAADPWTIFRGIDFMGGPNEPESVTNAYQLMAGVEGRFSNRDWTWDASARAQRQELVAHLDESHRVAARLQGEIEEPAVEFKRLVDVTNLQCHMVDADQAGFLGGSVGHGRFLVGCGPMAT
jgi:hypothetical protein